MAVDVLVVGAGPAGSVAATVLARAGVRVRLLDRARFPRPKLCGDTLNPGALQTLRRLRLSEFAEATGLPLSGMRVSGPGGVTVEACYPPPLSGCAISRCDLDVSLVERAVTAGAQFDGAVTARRPMFSERVGKRSVTGVECQGLGLPLQMRAKVVIAADGRHSALAFALGLASHPVRPRRWAIGACCSGVERSDAFGEMHIRRDRYIGIAPLPGQLTNVCVVGSQQRLRRIARAGGSALLDDVRADPGLRDRFSCAVVASPLMILGPLAVDRAHLTPPDGLLLAGDAAGFVDPMTGDGLRFAIRGGELAAHAALAALERGWPGVHDSLEYRRRAEFAGKWRFNRTLRAMVASPSVVQAAAAGARVVPALVRSLILHASDCALAGADAPLEPSQPAS